MFNFSGLPNWENRSDLFSQFGIGLGTEEEGERSDGFVGQGANERHGDGELLALGGNRGDRPHETVEKWTFRGVCPQWSVLYGHAIV